MTVLDNLINSFKEIPDKLSNTSSETLIKYGSNPIKSLLILRSPLKFHWTGSLELFSFGKFGKYAKKNGLDSDKLFHLSLIAYVDDKHIIVEKNEVVNIKPIDLDKKLDEKGAEILNLHLNKNITLNEMIENTYKFMGETKFFDYDGIGVNGVTNNCQDFVNALLSSNNLMTKEAHDFTKQNIESITNDILNDKTISFLPKLVKGVTNFGSKISRLIGRGKNTTKEEKALYNYIKYIDERGWEFL